MPDEDVPKIKRTTTLKEKKQNIVLCKHYFETFSWLDCDSCCGNRFQWIFCRDDTDFEDITTVTCAFKILFVTLRKKNHLHVLSLAGKKNSNFCEEYIGP